MNEKANTPSALFKQAYDFHYDDEVFPVARYLYNKVISDFPNSVEAGYARAQLRNIDESESRSVGTEKGLSIEPEVYFQGRMPTKTVMSSSLFDEKVSNIILTTAPQIDGFMVEKTLEIITSECVCGMNLFADFFTSLSDTFGGRSETTQNALREARRTCLKELKLEGARLGADAVIAVDLDYSEFTGKGKSMLFLVASGTAVTLRPR